MIGELSALAASLSIAASAVICRSLAVFITPRPLQTMRAWFGGFFLFALAPLLGTIGQIGEVPFRLFALMAGSAVFGVALGDTLYMKTLSMVEASRSFPTVRGIQIISTMIVAAILFGEEITWATGVGAFLLMGGIYLAAFGNPENIRGTPTRAVPLRKWVLPAFIAGLCWTGSFAFMNAVLKEINPITAQTFRLPFAVVILTAMTLQAKEGRSLRIFSYKRKTLILLILAGVLSYGIGVVFELYAVSFAGMANAAILTSWTPLFILILSAVVLKEKITLRLVLGVLLCSGGTIVLMAF